MTQQSHSWAYTQRKTEFEKIQALQCSSQHYLQQPGHGYCNRGMDKEEKMWCLYISIYTHMEYTYIYTYNGIHMYIYTHTHIYIHNGIHMYIRSFEDTWMDLEIVNLSEVCQTQKDKYYMT